MKYILFSLIFVLSIACDQPVNNRLAASSASQTTESLGRVSDSKIDVLDSDSSDLALKELANCDFSHSISGGSYLESFSICRSTVDTGLFSASFSKSHLSGLCFIPLYRQDDGKNSPIGDASCSVINADQKIVIPLKISDFRKELFGITERHFNGVAIVHASAQTAYSQCKHAKNNYYIGTQGCCTKSVSTSEGTFCTLVNSQCIDSAQEEEDRICAETALNHEGKFITVEF